MNFIMNFIMSCLLNRVALPCCWLARSVTVPLSPGRCADHPHARHDAAMLPYNLGRFWAPYWFKIKFFPGETQSLMNMMNHLFE